MSKVTPSLERRLVNLMQSAGYQPLKQHELLRALKMKSVTGQDIRHALKSLEGRGEITRLRKNRYALPSRDNQLIGDLSVHPDGFGFVTQLEGDDIFIPARMMHNALHGDRVEVIITRSAQARRAKQRQAKKTDRPDLSRGQIARVIERRCTRLAGLYKKAARYAYVIPDSPRVALNIHVQKLASSAEQAKDGHKVIVELNDWPDPRDALTGVIVEDLGPADDPGVAMASLIRARELNESFPVSVEKSAKRMKAGRSTIADSNRRDLRDEFLFTIDPEDARDFDDAVSLKTLPDGQWQLGVHIADVATYVEADSYIDKEAQQRATSVYLVDRVIQMLPRHLTEHVCSLVPHEERFAHTIRMTISPRGQLMSMESFPSRIKSAARLTYDEVQAHLTGQTPEKITPPLGEALTQMDKLASLLRRRRARKGSILFEMPEVRCVLNENGLPTDIVPRISFRAYHLIEEFMLIANQAVALKLSEHGYPTLYRIHEPPDDEQWERMAADLASLGFTLADTTSKDMNKVADAVADSPLAHIINLAMLRNLKRATYSGQRAEHFGLAFSHYLHFTSPIRRYPDLITHRVLKALEQGEPPPYSKREIASIAEHCSRMEREAQEAEQESVELKRIEYYARQLEEGAIGPWQAVITGMNGRGLQVELLDTLQRGLIPFSRLRDDHYAINAQRNQAVGRRTRNKWKLGDVASVELLRVDTARKQIEFSLAETNESDESTSSPRRRARSRKRRR